MEQDLQAAISRIEQKLDQLDRKIMNLEYGVTQAKDAAERAAQNR